MSKPKCSAPDSQVESGTDTRRDDAAALRSETATVRGNPGRRHFMNRPPRAQECISLMAAVLVRPEFRILESETSAAVDCAIQIWNRVQLKMQEYEPKP